MTELEKANLLLEKHFQLLHLCREKRIIYKFHGSSEATNFTEEKINPLASEIERLSQ